MTNENAITYLEIVGEVEETLTLSQLMDLECIVSAQIKERKEEYRAHGADTYETEESADD